MMEQSQREVFSIYVFYADVFLLTNLLLNLCVFIFTTKIRKIHKKHGLWRMVGASTFGAVLALGAICLTKAYMGYVVLTHFVILPFAQLLAFGKRKLPLWWRDYLCSYVVTVLLGGINEAFKNVLGMHTIPWLLWLASVLLGGSMVQGVLKEKRIRKTLYPVTLKLGDSYYSCMGLIDTGNRLRMPKYQKGINLVNERILEAFKKEALDKKGEVGYESLGMSQGKIMVYQIKWLCVGEAKEEKYIEHALIALAPCSLFEGKEYDVILEGDLWEELK